jgi:hypothetical protein
MQGFLVFILVDEGETRLLLRIWTLTELVIIRVLLRELKALNHGEVDLITMFLTHFKYN